MIRLKEIGTAMRRSPRLTALSLAAIITLAAAVGCGVGGGHPNTEAAGAARQIASEVREYRGGDAETVENTELFAMAYHRVQQHYVHPTENAQLMKAAVQGMRKTYPDPAGATDIQLIEAAIQGMLGSLDDYSVYFDSESYRKLNQEIHGTFGGLGIEIKKDPAGLKVISPIEGTPAMRVGIQPGDLITHADGMDLGAMTLQESVETLRGRPGEPVIVTVRRDARTAPFDVRIVREIIHIQSVKSELRGDVGYIRITHFISDTGDRLRKSMRDLHREADGRLRGYVIDLRNNPGGLLEESIDVAGAFLAGGAVVSTRGRMPTQVFEADPGDPSAGLPVAVLINEGSASASEIVAGAIKDRGRGVVLGTKSFGKGSVQTTLPLSDGRGMKLTTALYFTPSGKTVEGGVKPDMEAVDNRDTKDVDEALDTALRTVSDLAGDHSVMWNAGTVKN